MDDSRLEVVIYQLVDDATMRPNRDDGTGWDWSWADWQRDWMSATPGRFAYRCLPLTIANQAGWWIKNPVGFTATWNGEAERNSIVFRFDTDGDFWAKWVTDLFGSGIITWNTPFLFRTRPRGSRLLVCGPTNMFKFNAQPLTALIESDWIAMSFTMNWKVLLPSQPVRFELGEPIFQAIPIKTNLCADLEDASASYRKLDDDPDLSRSYREWDRRRSHFVDRKAGGELTRNGFEMDYFQGRDAIGRSADTSHMIKIRPPRVQYREGSGPPRDEGASVALGQIQAGRRDDLDSPLDSSNTSKTMHTIREQATTRDPAAEMPVGGVSVGVAQEQQQEAAPSTNGEGSAAQVTRRADDNWRRWIAENLMTDIPPEDLADVLERSGFAREDAVREIALAREHPYFMAAELLLNRLKKREWVLAAHRKLRRLQPSASKIERRHCLSRHEFLAEYYAVNRPVIITGMMDDWPALGNWTLEDLARRFGERLVEVQTGREADANYEINSRQHRTMMPFGNYIELIRTSGATNDYYMTANNGSYNRRALAELWDEIVQVPEYLDASNPGGFLWLGPAGTFTPLHHDLTNNLMAQVIGRKRIKLAPSWDIPLMQNHKHVYSQIDGRTRPAAPEAPFHEPQILELVLNPGEILFLPVGSVHCVEGLDITLTVSFTNFLFDNDFSSFYVTYGLV